MTSVLRRRPSRARALASIAVSVISTAAVAQDAGSDPEKRKLELEEIVVTGTLIRGVAPVGASVIGVSDEEIKSTGALTMNQVLSQIPQSTDFNDVTQPGGGVIGANSRVPITRPNFRNLPGGGGSSSGAVTLVLLNGHRIVPQGIEQAGVDPDVIAPGSTARIETILDGASAIYGSDAVGGVINFITRKSLDGFQADVRYGVADDYSSWDANLSGGTSWETGSLFATFSHGESDELFGHDRDYVQSIDWTTGIPSGRSCDLANSTVGVVSYPAPTFAPGAPNSCDSADYSTIVPSVERNNVYFAVSQDIGQSVNLNIDAFYSNRKNEANTGPFRGSAIMRPTNPYYRQFAGTPTGAQQTVTFSYGPVLGDKASTNDTELEVGQITPTLTIDLTEEWQLRTLVGYGRSKTSTNNATVHSPTQAIYASGTSLATAINPYDIAATQNRALFDTLSYDSYTAGEYEFLNPRVTADGKLFDLPGGSVRTAFGAEYAKTDFEVLRTDPITKLLLAPASASQDVVSAFAEVLIPIVGTDNNVPGIDKLELSLSGRYDDYSDFGSNTSPKFALTYDANEWLTLRGNWGKSFNAPTVTDVLGAKNTLIRKIGPPPIQFPGGLAALPTPNSVQLIMTGALDELEPQTSTNWSVGFDIRPTDSLTVSGSYYAIDFKDIISLPQTGASIATAMAVYPELFPYYPNLTQQQILSFAAQAPDSGPAAVQSAIAQGQTIVMLIDNRTRNLGGTKVAGIDLLVAFSQPTSFGSLDARINGNYQLDRDTQNRPGGTTIDDLQYGIADLAASLSLGANVGDFRAQATLNHAGGYDIDPTTPNLCACQTEVDAFNVVNLFFSYEFAGTGLLDDLVLSLNVNNVSDEEPPVYKVNALDGYANGRTVGRFIQFGLSKTF